MRGGGDGDGALAMTFVPPPLDVEGRTKSFLPSLLLDVLIGVTDERRSKRERGRAH